MHRTIIVFDAQSWRHGLLIFTLFISIWSLRLLGLITRRKTQILPHLWIHMLSCFSLWHLRLERPLRYFHLRAQHIFMLTSGYVWWLVEISLLRWLMMIIGEGRLCREAFGADTQVGPVVDQLLWFVREDAVHRGLSAVLLMLLQYWLVVGFLPALVEQSRWIVCFSSFLDAFA